MPAETQALPAVSLTNMGHSCLMLEIPGVNADPYRILLDPGNLSASYQGRVDAVLVTHGHPDHLDAAKIQELLDHGPVSVYGPAELRAQLEKLDVKFTATEPGGFELAGIKITASRSTHETIYPGVPLPENFSYDLVLQQ